MTLLVVVVFFGAVEITFRARGMKPSYQDTPRHWAYWRAQASSGGRDAVVLLGSSRMQLGLDPAILAQELPDRRIIQLAINGGTPFPVLSNLANDEQFNGLIIVEASPYSLFLRDEAQVAHTRAWVESFEGRSRVDDLEARLRGWLQSNLIILRPEFRPTLFLLKLALHKELPAEGYIRMHFTRWIAADYSKRNAHVPNGELNGEGVALPATSGLRARFANFERVERGQRSAAVAADVAKIEGRGGRVVFLRMPSAHAIREWEEEFLPKKGYYDPFVEQVKVSALHFEDFPELQGHHLPDGQHLDVSSVPAFSRGVARILKTERLLD